MHPEPTIHASRSGFQEIGVLVGVGHDPLGVLVVVDVLARVLRIHGVDPCVGVADRHRVREDLLQPIIGVELLALHDPDRAELSCQFGVEPTIGLLLDDLVHHVEEADVVGHDRVVARQARHVLELHLRRVVLLGQWVHLEVLLDVVRWPS